MSGDYESDLIHDALKTTRGNRKRAAQLLDTTERILRYKIKSTVSVLLRFLFLGTTLRRNQFMSNRLPPLAPILLSALQSSTSFSSSGGCVNSSVVQR